MSRTDQCDCSSAFLEPKGLPSSAPADAPVEWAPLQLRGFGHVKDRNRDQLDAPTREAVDLWNSLCRVEDDGSGGKSEE